MRTKGLSRRAWLCWSCLGASFAQATEHTPPPLMRAGVYDTAKIGRLVEYWVSEKLDGVRAYWNGHRLLTRAGHPIATPPWFTMGWPAVPLDGELWGGRGTFEHTSGVVRREVAVDREWRALRFMVFDLPGEPAVFTVRLDKLSKLIEAAKVPSLSRVTQFRLADVRQLQARLLEVERGGGEGLMLHYRNAIYLPARTDSLLKVKSLADAEARVVEHIPGRGKYEGKMGALLVERPDGVRFRIGSGFSDAERSAPPAVGTRVTYSYNGETRSGIPRFARFVRVRDAAD